MSAIEKYQAAAFRDIPCLMVTEEKKGGPKVVVHEYPNSRKRYVEPMGGIPPLINMNLRVHGDDAINKRLNFEAALDNPDTGTLLHPIYGILQVKVIGPYSVKSTQKDIGQFTFNINFATTEEIITPSVEAIDTGQVSADANVATAALDTALEESYIEPSFTDSLIAAADKITAVTQSINNQIVKVVEPIQENVAAFNRVVSSVQSGALTIMSQADTLKQTVEDLYDGFRDIAQLPQDLTNSWKSLTDFNLFRSAPKTSTVKRAEIANNERNLDTHTRLSALARSFESYAYTDFQTDISIDDARLFLESKYDELILQTGSELNSGSIIDPETGDTISGDVPIPAVEESSSTNYVGYKDISINQDVRTAFATLRVNALKLLDEKEQNAFRVREIAVRKSSLTDIAYRYYGGIDNLSILQELNPEKNHAFINGTLKVVAQ